MFIGKMGYPSFPSRFLNFIVDHTSPKILANHTVCCFITAFIAVLTIFLNSVSVLAFWKSIQLRRKITNFLIFVLSLNDLAVGLFAGPLYILLLAREMTLMRSSDDVNYINLASVLFFTGMSFETPIVMSFERYLGIVHPLFHKTKVNKEHLIKCLVVTWIVGGLQILLLFFSYGDFFVQLKTVEVIVCMILLPYMYVKIYLTVQRSRDIGLRVFQNRVCPEEAPHFKEKSLLQNLKLAKSCFLVIISSYVCFLPVCVVTIIRSQSEVAYMATNWSQTILLLNSCSNSILFFWRNNCLCKEALILIGCAPDKNKSEGFFTTTLRAPAS